MNAFLLQAGGKREKAGVKGACPLVATIFFGMNYKDWI